MCTARRYVTLSGNSGAGFSQCFSLPAPVPFQDSGNLRSSREGLADTTQQPSRLLLCCPVYPLLWTLAILSPVLPPHPCLTHRLRLLDLRNLTLRLLAAPPGTCQPFTPSLAEHLEDEEGQTRRPGWAVVKPGHGNR
ncbi:hypothetical protein NQZ68_002061 [Dissostichus eleginoides]|nr:hypothetical protein NQZ68_002061 [Dissostichus eleginoides]